MSFVPAMWIVWAGLVIITLIISVFKGRLERDEEDLLFLDDTLQNEKAAQDALVRRVTKVQPVLRGSIMITGAGTLVLIAYYLRDIYVQLFGR